MLLTYKKQNFKVAFCDMLADYINYNLSDIIISPLCKIIGLPKFSKLINMRYNFLDIT